MSSSAASSVNNDLTSVTDSAAPSDTNDAATDFCQRAAGQVCVCDGCETDRTRLLVLKKKRKRDEDDTTTAASTPPVAPVAIVASKSKNRRPSFSVASGSTSASEKEPDDEDNVRLAKMSAACKTILECIGEDPNREGLVKTPQRWAKSLLFMCSGYQLSPEEVTNDAVFSEQHNEMVVVKNIDVHSLCEHHMVPFTGRVHIGYIPNGQIIGLSKLARIAELFARRLQVQERLTRQIADAVAETVQPLGVAVVMEATHYCMVMRGVQKTAAVTTTSSVRGCFESNPKTRAEFFSIIHQQQR